MNSETLNVYKKFNNKSICALPQSTDHSLISRFDKPDIEMWWLEDMLENIINF